MSLTRLGVTTAAVLSAGLLAGCWSSPAEPMVVAGLRMAGEQLEYWAGTQCPGVGQVTVEVPGKSGADAEHTWTMTAQEGSSSLETFVVGDPPSGFVADAPAPDWPPEGTVRVQVRDDDGGVLGSHLWSLGSLAESGDHPGEWYAEGHGWVDEEGFAELADEGAGSHPFCEVPQR
ncbi:hypothetical protein [Ornithinimicrobium pratense]|uniref:Lipoprotein n=1 Tax=Ornithinimicrobium pratense TaxID=2593973 RepID=A0A5J6V4P1_9MICO|nr:hypothetical protein [Ornithinimicrobium pratense]QFG68950.1 hypothetical protein FY030_09755 [Ornithinimicrobium pratense]